jgi:hypothetical protein
MFCSKFRTACKMASAGIALAILASAPPSVATAAVVDSYSTGFEDFNLGAMSDGTTTQKGWSGGAQSGFQNATPGDEAITTAAAHTGSQSWRLTHGYSTPGQGSPFSPNLSAGLGDPGITDFVGSLWFRGVGVGDNSSIAINSGNMAGTDRAVIIAYLVNEPAGINPAGIHLYTFGDNFAAIDIATGLDPTVWHELTYTITKNGSTNSLTTVVDGGAPLVVNPDGLSDFRADTSNPYSDSSRLKFNTRLGSSGAPATPDPNALGFYIDDISYSVIGAAAVPETSSLIVWSLLGLTIGGGSWWRRKRSA